MFIHLCYILRITEEESFQPLHLTHGETKSLDHILNMLQFRVITKSGLSLTLSKIDFLLHISRIKVQRSPSANVRVKFNNTVCSLGKWNFSSQNQHLRGTWSGHVVTRDKAPYQSTSGINGNQDLGGS